MPVDRMKTVASVCCALALATIGATARAQVMLAAGEPADSFVTANWVANLPGPMDVAFLPDGRALILLKEGEAVVRTAEGTLVRNAGSFAVKAVDNEQGLLGAVAHPDFATNKTIFFYASIGADIANKNQILRGTIGDDHKLTVDTANPLIVFEGPHKHQGSGLHIHKGHLYVATGDSGTQNPLPINKYASCLNKPNGKILRMNLDGSAPADNPLSGMTQVTGCTTETRTTGNFSMQPPDRRIWAWGLRNPFKVWLDPQTDLFWMGDVGERQREEVSVGGRGQHFGYPFEEGTYKYSRQQIPFDTIGGCKGMVPSTDCSPPAFEYPNGGAGGDSAIIGGLIPSGCGWPAAFTGRYLFGDHMSGRLWTLDVTPDRRGVVAGSRKNFGSLRGIVGFRMGTDGSLYLVSFEANAVARVTPKNRPPTCPASPADAGAATDTAAPGGTGGAGGDTQPGSPTGGRGGSDSPNPTGGAGGASPTGGSGSSPASGGSGAGTGPGAGAGTTGGSSPPGTGGTSGRAGTGGANGSGSAASGRAGCSWAGGGDVSGAGWILILVLAQCLAARRRTRP
jgi:glucose/arabinose dehydrogenase